MYYGPKSFSSYVRDGQLYGRGSDMKTSIIVASSPFNGINNFINNDCNSTNNHPHNKPIYKNTQINHLFKKKDNTCFINPPVSTIKSLQARVAASKSGESNQSPQLDLINSESESFNDVIKYFKACAQSKPNQPLPMFQLPYTKYNSTFSNLFEELANRTTTNIVSNWLMVLPSLLKVGVEWLVLSYFEEW
ncbi:hypothetical protein ACTFIU_006148 [Dictyostelium citrinum]